MGTITLNLGEYMVSSSMDISSGDTRIIRVEDNQPVVTVNIGAETFSDFIDVLNNAISQTNREITDTVVYGGDIGDNTSELAALEERLKILEDVKERAVEHLANQPSLSDKVNNFITKKKEIAEQTAKFAEELDELVESVYEETVLPYFRELYPTLDILAQELGEKNITISIDWSALESDKGNAVLFYANSNGLYGIASDSTIEYICFANNRYIMLDKDDMKTDMSYECKKTLVQNFPLIKEKVESSIFAFLDKYLASEEKKLNDTKENVGNIKNGKKGRVEIYDLDDGVPY